MNTQRRMVLAAMLMGAAAPAALAGEPAWPSKPVRIIVTGASGSVPDVLARWLAERLTPLLGQPVVIDNKPGGAPASVPP